MRKLILLFLLSVAGYGQTANGTETKQNAFRSLSPQTVTSPVFVTTMGTDGTMGKASVNNLPLSIPTKDYVDANIPAVYTTIVYVNATSPTTATIFDDENPPTVNDDALKINVANLYIGTDGSTWVYKTSPAGYVTKVVPATSNFNLYNTSIDAGNNKESIIERFGAIASKSGNIVRKNGSDSVLGGGYFSFYNNAITSGNTFQLNASNGLDLWNFASGSWNKRFTFSDGGYLTATNGILIGGTGTTNYVPKFTASGTLGNSTSYDSAGLKYFTGANDADLSYGIGKGLSNSNSAFFGWRYNGGNPLGFIETYGSIAPFSIQSGGGRTLIGTTIDNMTDILQVAGTVSATSYTGSATLTGTPTAPTATAGTNTTQIATTAFVQGATSGLGKTLLLDKTSTTYNAVSTGAGQTIKTWVIPANTIPADCILKLTIKTSRLLGSANPWMSLSLNGGTGWLNGVNGTTARRNIIINDTTYDYHHNSGTFIDDIITPQEYGTYSINRAIDNTLTLKMDCDVTGNIFKFYYIMIEIVKQ